MHTKDLVEKAMTVKHVRIVMYMHDLTAHASAVQFQISIFEMATMRMDVMRVGAHMDNMHAHAFPKLYLPNMSKITTPLSRPHHTEKTSDPTQ